MLLSLCSLFSFLFAPPPHISPGFSPPFLMPSLENIDQTLSIAQSLYQKKHYQSLLHTLNPILNELSGLKKAQAHIFIARAYLEGLQHLDHFIFHAEEAIQFNLNPSDRLSLHLALFEAYLQLAKESEPEEKSCYSSQAATHLFKVFLENASQIDRTDLLWLARHYAQTNDFQKVSDLLTYTLKVNCEEVMPPLSHSEIILEPYILLLAQTWDQLHLYDEALLLLEFLRGQQSCEPDWKWQHCDQTLSLMGSLYEKVGKQIEAINCYDLLLSSDHLLDSSLFNLTKLRRARLGYILLSLVDPSERNEELSYILKLLKELQMRKQLLGEPIHLEAAIDYAEISAKLTPKVIQPLRLIFLLKLVKKDFSNREDLWTNDYLHQLDSEREKAALFHAYMLLIDAHIAKLQSATALCNGKSDEAAQYAIEAQHLYHSLLSNESISSDYLTWQAHRGLSELSNTNNSFFLGSD